MEKGDIHLFCLEGPSGASQKKVDVTFFQIRSAEPYSRMISLTVAPEGTIGSTCSW